jgi:hypothetical protein
MKRLLVVLVALCTLGPVGPAFAADNPPDDRFVVSGSVVVDKGEVVPGSVVVLDGDVLIRGTVKGDVVAVSGDVTVRGRIGGDLVTVDGQAILGRAARISGDLVYLNDEPVVSPGAQVAGDTKKLDGGEFGDALQAIAFGIWVAFTVSLLLFGLIMMLLAPKAAEAIARTARHKWGMSIGVGIAVPIVLLLVAVLCLISIIAFPLGLILFASLVPLFALAFCASAFALGRLMLKNSGIPAFLLGMVILCLLALVPFLGGLTNTLAIIFGLGLLFTTLFRARA